MMLRKRGRRVKRSVSERLDDEAKENNTVEMSEDAVSADPSSPGPINKKVKMEAEDEPPASKSKSDYWRSSSLSHARLPNFTSVKNLPVKSENPSAVVLLTGAISLQNSGIGSPSVVTPKPEPADKAAADLASHCNAPSQATGCPDSSHPLSEMQAVVGKPTPVGKSETAARDEAVFNAGISKAKDSALKSEENEISSSSISPSCALELFPMVILTFCEEQSVAPTPDMLSERKETIASPVSSNCSATLPEMNCQMQDVSKIHCSETSRVLEQVAESLMEVVGQMDEVEVVEISKKEFEVVDLTDDVVSPASTLPPSPADENVVEDPETGPISPLQNVEFPTPLLPLLKKIPNLNIETILQIEALFSEVVLVSLSSEDDEEGTMDDESVIMCDPPSDNGMEEKQAKPIESDDDDITILETPQSSELTVKLSTSPEHENFTALSNILATPSQNILPSTPMTLECFGAASPIETSSSSKTESVVLPTMPPIQELFSAVVPATSETAPSQSAAFRSTIQELFGTVAPAVSETYPSQSVVFPSTPPIQEPFPVVIPAISESTPSQTAVHRSIIKEIFTTAAPAVSKTAPSQNTKTIVPLTPPKQSADDHSVVPMDISPPSTSPFTKSLISSDRISKDVLIDIIKTTDQSNLFAPNQNTASNLDSTRNTISSLFQQPSVAQTKRPLSPEDASQDQHTSKRLGINEYRMRKIADPRRRSTSPLTTPSPPVTNSPQTASPYSANGNYFSPPQSNLITVFPSPQLQSNLLTAQALTQYPVQNHFNLANRTRTQCLLQNIVPPLPQHQPQNLSHEERTAQFSAQQFSSGGIAPPRLSFSNHPSHFDRRSSQTRYAPVPHVQLPLHKVLQTQPPLPSTPPPKQPPLPSIQPAKQPPLPSTRQTRPPLGARPHLPPTQPFAPRATNLLQSVRQVAVASVVRPPTRLAQPYSGEQQPRSFVSSVPASFRGSVGQRLIPSNVLHLIVIDWDVTAMHDLYRKNEFPKNLATEFNQVRNSYTDLLDYYNTYFPLMLVEFWNKLFAAYNAHQRKEFFFCVADFQVTQTQVDDDDTRADTYLVTCNTVVRTCDVELVPKSMQVCVINCLSGRFLGYVREAFRRDYSVYHDKSHATLERNSLSANDGVSKSKMRLIIEFACSPLPFKPKDLFACSKLANVKGLLKQNETLLRLEGSSLKRVLLNPLMEQCVELIRLPLSKNVDEMSMALSALTYRVRQCDHHVTLVGFSESHERADQLMALVQIVQRLRHGIGRRLLVCCREEKMEESAEKMHSLGFETVLLERELRSLGKPYLSFDALAKKSSVRHVLENCEVMLAATGYCFYEDLLNEAEASGAHFDTCVIFDAHCLTEPESLVPLAYPVRHLVMVGVPGKLSKISAMTAHWDFGKSLFQRAYDTSG